MEINNSFTELIYNIKQEYKRNDNNYPWIVGYSGGKDSTLVCHLIFSILLRIDPKERTRNVYIISNDTLVESPLVGTHTDKTIELMQITAEMLNLPIHTYKTKPDSRNTFWVLLIGRGYPTPTSHMRWCTDRLKIRPTTNFIKEHIAKDGAAIIVLGVRKDESNARKRSIEKHETEKIGNLSPHHKLSKAFVYSPIVSITTATVWDYLTQETPPWGGSYEELIQLYQSANGGNDLRKTKSSSRFGCWVCTLIKNDRSLEYCAKTTHNEKLYALINFRNWLQSIRNNPEYRQIKRRSGRILYDKNGVPIPGPFSLKARKIILNNLLKTQDQYEGRLITKEEIDTIFDLWEADLSK